MDNQPQLVIGQRIGDYTVHSLLHLSASATVFRGTKDQRHYVVKLVAAGDVRRLQLVAELLRGKRLVNVSVPQLERLGSEKQQWILVAPYVTGKTLKELIDERQAENTASGKQIAGSYRQLLSLCIKAVKGLISLHRAGVCHGDIKPANLLVTRSGKLKILDLDTARPLPQRDFTAPTIKGGAIWGTIPYIYPPLRLNEALSGLDLQRADYYSLALTMIEFYSGTCAVELSKEEFIERMDEVDPQCPAELSRYESLAQILGNLASWYRDFDKEYRYDDESVLLRDLVDIAREPLRRVAKLALGIALGLSAVVILWMLFLTGTLDVTVDYDHQSSQQGAAEVEISTTLLPTKRIVAPRKDVNLPGGRYRVSTQPSNHYSDTQAVSIIPWQTSVVSLKPQTMLLWQEKPPRGVGYFGTPALWLKPGTEQYVAFAGTFGLFGEDVHTGITALNALSGQPISKTWDGQYPPQRQSNITGGGVGIKETSVLIAQAGLVTPAGVKPRTVICAGTVQQTFVVADAQTGKMLAELTPLEPRDSAGHDNDAAPAAVDLDNDGIDELFVANQGGAIDAYELLLNPLPEYADTLYQESLENVPPFTYVARRLWEIDLDAMPTTPVIADVTGDGRPELITGCKDGLLYALDTAEHPQSAPASRDDAGRIVATFDTGTHSYLYPASVADLTGDDCPEIVFGSEQKEMFVVSYRKESGEFELVTKHFFTDAGGHSALADLTGDGIRDIVCAGNDGVVRCLTLDQGRLHEIWKFYTRGEIWGSASISYLDDDRTPDVAIGSRDGSFYFLSGKDGSPIGEFRTSGEVWRSPVLRDLNHDGAVDAVGGCCLQGPDKNEGVLYAIAGRAPAPRWSFQGPAEFHSLAGPYNLDSRRPPGVVLQFYLLDVNGHQTDKQFFVDPRKSPADRGFFLYKSPARDFAASQLADVNGDGTKDLIQTTLGAPSLVVVDGATGQTTFPSGSIGVSARHVYLASPGEPPNVILVDAYGSEMQLFSLADNRILDSLELKDQPNAMVSYTAGNRYYAIAFTRSTGMLYKIEVLGSEFSEPLKVESGVANAAFSLVESPLPGETPIGIAYNREQCKVFDLTTMKPQGTYECNAPLQRLYYRKHDAIMGLALDHNRRIISIWPIDNSANMNSFSYGQVASRFVGLTSRRPLDDPARAIDSIVLREDHAVKWLDLANGREIWRRELNADIVDSLLIEPRSAQERPLVIVAMEDGLVQCYEMRAPLAEQYNWDTFQGNKQRTGAFPLEYPGESVRH